METKDNLVNQAPPPPYSPPPYNNQQYGGNFNTSYSSPLGDSAGFNQPGHGSFDQPPMTVVTTQPMHTGQMSAQVPDHMGLAVFVMLCCCWPLGLLAMNKASESRLALQNNDLVNAHLLAQDSRRTSIQGMIIGVVILAVTLSITVGVIAYLKTVAHQ